MTFEADIGDQVIAALLSGDDSREIGSLFVGAHTAHAAVVVAFERWEQEHLRWLAEDSEAESDAVDT